MSVSARSIVIIILLLGTSLSLPLSVINGKEKDSSFANTYYRNNSIISQTEEEAGALPAPENELIIPFRFPTPTLSEEGDFIRVEMDDALYFSQDGKPVLPKYTHSMTLPPDTRISSNDLWDISYYEMNVEGEIIPAAPSQPHMGSSYWGDAPQKYYDGEKFTDGPAEVFRDEDIYGSDAAFPSNWFEMRTGMGRDPVTDEQVLFVMIDFYPVRYLPSANICLVATDAQIVLKTLTVEGNRASARSGPGTDMVIIGPESMRETASPLAAHKTYTGLDTIYVSLDDIYNSVYFPLTGSNNPEKIKYFIKNALDSWDITYVLLAGDSDICPVRYAWVPDGFDDNGANKLDGADVPSDAYYADIYNSTGQFCDWNANGNSRYGEETDECDLYYDVYVGRLPAGNNAELTDMVNDIIYYENNTLGADWFSKANLHATDTFGWAAGAEGEMTLDKVVDNGYLAGFDVTRYYETLGTCNKNAIVSGLNGGAGFAAFSDHGDHHCWGATGGGNGIFDYDDALTLTNGKKLPVVTFDACLTGSFDNELKPSLWTENPGESISEKLLLNTGGGAIAVISSTRIGWGDGGTNYYKHRSGFIDVNLYKAYQEGKRTPGRMLAGSIAYYLSEVGDHDDKDHKTLTEHICLGDPSLAIGGLPLDASIVEGTATIIPGASGHYVLRASNKSPFGENVEVDFTKLPPGFSGVAAQNTPVIPNGDVDISISITPPRGLVAGSVHELSVGILCRGRGKFLETNCIIGKDYGVTLSSPLTDDTTDPGAKVPFWIDLKNRGNVEDTFELSFLENLPGWDVWAQNGNITLPPFESTNTTIYILPANNTLFGTRRITLVASSQGSNGTKRAMLKFNITIRYIYGFDLGDLQDMELLPGRYILLEVPLNNTGNGDEKFDFEVTGRPENWTVSLKDFYLQIDAYSTRNFTIEVSVPTDALAGDYPVGLKVSSSEGNQEKRVPLDIKVSKIRDLKITCPDKSMETDNLIPVNYTVKISNKGNFPDTVSLELHNFTSSFTSSLSEDTLELAPNQETEVILSVTPAKEAASGIYGFNLTATYESDPDYLAELKLELIVIPYYECNITPAKKLTRLFPGEKDNISFSVENLANTGDELIVQCWPVNALETGITVPTFIMENFSSGSGVLNIIAKNDALAGTYYLNLSVASTGAEAGGAFDWCLITVEVRKVFGLSVSPSNPTKEVGTGQTSYTFHISNEGNAPDEVRIEYSGSSADWLRSSLKNLSIAPGEDSGLTVDMLIPSGTNSGDYSLDIVVISVNDGEVIDRAKLNLSVTGDDTGGILGVSSSENFTIIGVAAAVVILITLIIVFIIVGKRRRKGKEKESPTKVPTPVFNEPPAPSYTDLYSNLPEVPSQSVTKAGEAYHEESDLYGEYYYEQDTYVEDLGNVGTFEKDGFFQSESYPTHTVEPDLTGWETEMEPTHTVEPDLTGWDDETEPTFRGTPMRTISSSKEHTKVPKASTKEKESIRDEKDEGTGDELLDILDNRTNVLDALFDFANESEDDEADEVEITGELEPVEEEEEKIELVWED
ncbi:MAG: C25 family cysteine peptidase [Candidatus Thermoplasmatota archaeon]|jgi:uncharacterized membrane protein|nr:C25 family cysteine peptidase [Candidatus Thermoplasmatota archaeon]